MNRLIVMVGLPGSGKSAFAREEQRRLAAYDVNSRIFSSDDIREELYGDANILGDSNEVFGLLEVRLFDYLTNNHGVAAIYDATNLTAKGRKAIINKVKRLPCVCYFECVFVACRLSECKRRQYTRDRKVPEEVIERMVRSFQAPFYNEGWDEIIIVEGGKLYDLPEEHVDCWDISHDNHHHQLSIGAHMAEARREAIRLVNELGYGSAAIEASYHHDIGKPHSKSFTNMKGEPTSEAHYYSHESISAYMWLSSNDAQLLDRENAFLIGSLIQWHMMPYFIAPKGQTATKEELTAWCSKHGFTEQFAEQLWVVHQADQSAH